MLVLVAAALLQTVRTETTAPDAQDNHSNNGELHCMYCKIITIILHFYSHNAKVTVFCSSKKYVLYVLPGAAVQPPSVLNLDNYLLQLNSKLDTITSKIETLDSKMETLDSTLDSNMEILNSRLQSSQETHSQQINALNSKLDTLTATTAQLSTEHQNLQTDISDVECTDSEESLELYQNLQNNLTHQLESIQSGLDTLIGPYTCGGTGGWRRVVYLDMTDSSTTCPSGWQLTGYSKRTCGRVSTGRYSCDSATFPVSGGEYTRVCGRIKAYQWGATRSIFDYLRDYMAIDGAYVSGVSVTHGSPRQHIWTFAAGLSEGNPTLIHSCPCDASIDISVPPFVGEDYFCESGVNGAWRNGPYTLYSNDTLWDGEDCLPSSRCCSQHNPPYFIKQLPTPTTDYIEARVCLYYISSQGNIAVELVELYVQ